MAPTDKAAMNGPSSSPFLPPEIRGQILTYIDNDSSLYSLCLVNKQWNQSAVSILYHTFNRNPPAKYPLSKLYNFACTLHDRPDLALLVKRIHVHDWAIWPYSYPRLDLISAERNGFGPRQQLWTDWEFKHGTKIPLPRFVSLDDPACLLMALLFLTPNVTILSLGIPHMASLKKTFMCVGESFQEKTLLPNLKVLSVDFREVGDIDCINAVLGLLQLPTLETFESHGALLEGARLSNGWRVQLYGNTTMFRDEHEELSDAEHIKYCKAMRFKSSLRGSHFAISTLDLTCALSNANGLADLVGACDGLTKFRFVMADLSEHTTHDQYFNFRYLSISLGKHKETLKSIIFDIGKARLIPVGVLDFSHFNSFTSFSKLEYLEVSVRMLETFYVPYGSLIHDLLLPRSLKTFVLKWSQRLDVPNTHYIWIYSLGAKFAKARDDLSGITTVAAPLVICGDYGRNFTTSEQLPDAGSEVYDQLLVTLRNRGIEFNPPQLLQRLVHPPLGARYWIFSPEELADQLKLSALDAELLFQDRSCTLKYCEVAYQA